MKTLIYNSLVAICLISIHAYASDINTPVTVDSRIKHFVYSENEIFPIVLHRDFQTSIEFGKDEVIQTYSVGNQFHWQFSAVGRTLFIKTSEDNIVTNMTVMTNKRRYYFDLYSKIAPEEVSYVVRFFYPDNNNDKIKIKTEEKIKVEDIAVIKPYNFNYEISGKNKEKVAVVFDNGTNMFFKIDNIMIDKINCDGKVLKPTVLGKYFMITNLCKKSFIEIEGHKITVFTK